MALTNLLNVALAHEAKPALATRATHADKHLRLAHRHRNACKSKEIELSEH